MNRVIVFKSSVLPSDNPPNSVSNNQSNNNLLRRITFPYVANVTPTFSLLKQKLGGIHGFQNTAIFYKDDDGDVITLDTDRELQDLMKSSIAASRGSIRIFVQDKNLLDSACGDDFEELFFEEETAENLKNSMPASSSTDSLVTLENPAGENQHVALEEIKIETVPDVESPPETPVSHSPVSFEQENDVTLHVPEKEVQVAEPPILVQEAHSQTSTATTLVDAASQNIVHISSEETQTEQKIPATASAQTEPQPAAEKKKEEKDDTTFISEFVEKLIPRVQRDGNVILALVKKLSEKLPLANVDLLTTIIDERERPTRCSTFRGTQHRGWSPEKPTTYWQGIICDGCGAVAFTGNRYKCADTTCPDFDLCSTCFTSVSTLHPGHNFTELTTFDQLHRGVTCDGCGKKGIVGPRYKCADCPDYDLCVSCSKDAKEIHIPNHWFNRLDAKVEARYVGAKGLKKEEKGKMPKICKKEVSFTQSTVSALSQSIISDSATTHKPSTSSAAVPSSSPNTSAWSSPPPTIFVPPPASSSSPKSISPISLTLEQVEQLRNEREGLHTHGSFEDKMCLLVEFGFMDVDENEDMLEEYDGDVHKVIDVLLARQESGRRRRSVYSHLDEVSDVESEFD
ncbi:hypothetical protein HDV05_003742 [Chytridiales sp. JEL 0842]|nr:hypothetical protein HDV05_003742 [Chytridiales sp. JEL 0842]